MTYPTMRCKSNDLTTFDSLTHNCQLPEFSISTSAVMVTGIPSISETKACSLSAIPTSNFFYKSGIMNFPVAGTIVLHFFFSELASDVWKLPG